MAEKEIKPGDRFGTRTVLRMLTVEERKRFFKATQRYCECECDCGHKYMTRVCDLARIETCIRCHNRKIGHAGGAAIKAKTQIFPDQKYVTGWYWLHVLRNAKRRKIAVLATIEEVDEIFEKQGGRCTLTGDKLWFGTAAGKSSDGNASLDRIDSDKPYEAGNLQWIDKELQDMKMSKGQEKFLKLCSNVTDYQRSKKAA
jgi:hypothetical protein